MSKIDITIHYHSNVQDRFYNTLSKQCPRQTLQYIIMAMSKIGFIIHYHKNVKARLMEEKTEIEKRLDGL